MNYTLKCTTRGARLTRCSFVALMAFTFVSAPAHAVNFMCPIPSTPPDGTRLVVELPAKQTNIARDASSNALKGLEVFFSAIRQRELGNREAYKALSNQAAVHLLKSAKLFTTIELAGRSYDRIYAISIDSISNGPPGVQNTTRTLLNLLNLIGAKAPDKPTLTSHLILAAGNATKSLGQQIDQAADYSLSDPRFESVRYRLSIYVLLGDLLSRIGTATYFESTQ